MWNYVFFKHYLVSRPKNDLTGVENYIFELIKKESVDWIPIKTYVLNISTNLLIFFLL